MSRGLQAQASKMSVKGLEQSQIASLLSLSRLAEFKHCVEKVAQIDHFPAWLNSDQPELEVPVLWDEQDTSKWLPFHRLLELQH